MALASSYHQPPLFPTEPTEKACTGCGRLFPLTGFYRKRGTHDGLTTACKDCIKARVRAYQEQNQEKIRASRAARYEANPEQVKAQSRARYRRNREACLEQKRIAYEPERQRRKVEREAREQAREEARANAREQVCTACDRRLPLEAFYGKRTGKYGLTGRCKECIRGNVRAYHDLNRAACNARCAAYYAANREVLQAAARAYERTHRLARNVARKAWYAANAERARAANRAYAEANRERMRAYKRAYEDRNREALRERRRQWQRANAEKLNEASRRWYHRHKHDGRHQARRMRRRALEYAAEGWFSAEDVRLLYAAQQGLCAYCGVAVGDTFDVDHKMPLSRGGSNWPDNLAIACPRCNRSKCDATEKEYRDWLAKRR